MAHSPEVLKSRYLRRNYGTTRYNRLKGCKRPKLLGVSMSQPSAQVSLFRFFARQDFLNPVIRNAVGNWRAGVVMSCSRI